MAPERLTDYARLRVEAMLLRDQRGDKVSEKDWAEIEGLLERSWSELASAIQPERQRQLPAISLYSRYAIAIWRLGA